MRSLWRRVLASLGPGFITGAADDDPSGIATYSQTGAMFGVTQLWTVPFSFPFMTAVQELCGRIGLVTGMGLSGVIKKHYSHSLLSSAVFLLLLANTINIGADLGAMAAGMQLLFPVPFAFALVGITVLVLALEIFVPYPEYACILKYLTLSLFAYIATALIVTSDWPSVLYATVHPHFEWSTEYVLNVAAILGTTISPYLFFWQADEEAEEEVASNKILGVGKGVPKVRPADLLQMRVDTGIGMLFSQIITFSIITSVAVTLGARGFTQIQTAADAARALEPISGHFAALLFTLGIVGTGLLAVPVLAGSAGYAIAEALDWEVGLGRRFNQARGFYGVIVVATVVGLFVNFSSVGPMTMLYYAAIFNGVLAPPLMVLLLMVGNNKEILHDHTNSWTSNILVAFITVVMGVVALATIFATFRW